MAPTLVRARLASAGADGLAQSRCSAEPASDRSPTGPALRANPSPEVTDPSCRLPLPTLSRRLEAVHLGDLLRIWVRPGTKITPLPRLFKGRRERSGHRKSRGALRILSAYLRTGRFHARGDPYKEKTTLPGVPADVSEFGCVTAPGARRPHSPCPGRGILTPFPFGRSGADRLLECPTSERLSPIPKDRLTHVQLLFTWNPTPPQSSRVSLEYLLLPPRSAPAAAPGGLTPGTFDARRGDPPTRGRRKSQLFHCSLRPAAGCRPDASAPSIFRASCFGR
jgi:hypothetical protein